MSTVQVMPRHSLDSACSKRGLQTNRAGITGRVIRKAEPLPRPHLLNHNSHLSTRPRRRTADLRPNRTSSRKPLLTSHPTRPQPMTPTSKGSFEPSLTAFPAWSFNRSQTCCTHTHLGRVKNAGVSRTPHQCGQHPDISFCFYFRLSTPSHTHPGVCNVQSSF